MHKVGQSQFQRVAYSDALTIDIYRPKLAGKVVVIGLETDAHLLAELAECLGHRGVGRAHDSTAFDSLPSRMSFRASAF